jgi:hypothetical protein
MPYRILNVGIDAGILKTRQALFTSQGYDCLTATPEDVDEKLHDANYDLVILSMKLSPDEKRVIESKLPAATRALVLESRVWPYELLSLVAQTLRNTPLHA